jgi:hypothetical protein
LFVDFLRVRLLFFEFGLNLPDFFFFDDVLFMELSDLFFLLVDGLHLLLSLLRELLEFFLHPGYLVGSFSIFVALKCFFLSLSDFFERLFLFLKGFELAFEMLKFIFLFDNLVNIILAVEIPS